MILIKAFLAEQGVRLAVAKITRGRADQFRDFMAMLVFRAVYLDHSLWIFEQTFGSGFDNMGLAAAGRTQKEKITDRTGGFMPAVKA